MRACHGWRKRGSALCIPTPCSPPGTCAFLSWQLSGAVGTAESSRNVYGGCTAVATLEMLWLENQVLLQWADVLSLTPLFSSISSSGWGWWPETHWDFECGHLAWIQRQECWKSRDLYLLRFLSQCATCELGRNTLTSAAPSGWKKVNLLPWVEHAGVAVLHHQFGAFGEFHMWWRHFQHSFCSCSNKWIPGFF